MSSTTSVDRSSKANTRPPCSTTKLRTSPGRVVSSTGVSNSATSTSSTDGTGSGPVATVVEGPFANSSGDAGEGRRSLRARAESSWSAPAQRRSRLSGSSCRAQFRAPWQRLPPGRSEGSLRSFRHRHRHCRLRIQRGAARRRVRRRRQSVGSRSTYSRESLLDDTDGELTVGGEDRAARQAAC